MSFALCVIRVVLITAVVKIHGNILLIALCKDKTLLLRSDLFGPNKNLEYGWVQEDNI